MARIKIPAPLRKHTDGERAVVIEGAHLGEIMESLLERHPEMAYLLDESVHLAVFVDNDLVRTADAHWAERDVNGDTEITLIVPIAGGAEDIFSHGISRIDTDK